MTLSVLALLIASQPSQEQSVTIEVDTRRTVATVSPDLYGIFFEEINQAGEGGLYAELIRNRGMEQGNGAELPPGWSPLNEASDGTVALDPSVPFNEAHRQSLRIDRRGPSGRFGAENAGFWGIPAKKGASMTLTLWVKGAVPMDVSLENGGKHLAVAQVPAPGENWKRIVLTLTPAATDYKSKIAFVPRSAGVDWVAMASLMPTSTWKNRPNGMRLDLAETVNAMHPAFVRFPGGCYVEGGDRLADAFDWKSSVQPTPERKGLAHSMWGYSNSMGLGFHEYLQWCEDMGSAPLFVVNCGISHREIVPMDQMKAYVQNALDAIEYANGSTKTKWGALRAKNGHPRPFGLRYIEIGNENGAPWSFGGQSAYESRYDLVYDAIKKAHPEIVTIADNPVKHPMEILDEHYYEDPAWFWRNAHRYDSYDRTGPKIYVGEYAVTRGCGKGNLVAALGEAAFMTGMERNSDIVRMSSYAPLFKNVNNEQWNPDAIVFDDARSYGTPSYYVQSLFSNNRADRVLECKVAAHLAPPPPIQGGIGLETWRTQAEYRDIELTVDGKKVYSSDGIKPYGVNVLRGDWKVSEDGTIAQSSLDQDRRAMLKGIDLKGAKKYSLRLKARKLGGEEGFMIVLDGHDGGWLDWNIGGWGNTQTAFERNAAIVGRPVPGRIETGKWYDILLEREGNRTRGYVDGKLVQELVERGAPDFTAVAGVDDRAHEFVLKVVNGSEASRTAHVDLAGAKLGDSARVISLTGPSLTAENSFETPRLVAPKYSKAKWGSGGNNYTFAPRSVTILRISIAN